MSSFTYWPYDEVSLNACDEELCITTPWLKASTSLQPFDKDRVYKLKAKLEDKTLTPQDLPWVSEFFSHFHQYPVAYILPKNKEGKLDRHELNDQSLKDLNFQELLIKICGSLDRNEVAKLLRTRAFEWDQQSALDFASIDGRIHPESLFSIARRYHILEIITSDPGHEIFQGLALLETEQYKDQAALLVRQNHFVTEHCQKALKPALNIAQNASHLIEEFMKAERGHDKILKKALSHLGKVAEDVPVSLQTRALMAALEYLAGRNFLAFAMAVDAFERNNYEESDPLAKLLKEGGFDKAAEFINLHMKINDSGEHENIAQTFLKHMALCDRDYALEALKLMEVLSVLMTTISKSVFNSH